MDLVSSDFTEETEVTRILDTWEEKGSGLQSSHHSKLDGDDDSGVVNLENHRFGPQINILFRRHLSLIVRDPILYVGRGILFLLSTVVFAIVYLSARDDDQDQMWNKFWITIWVRM